MGGQLTDGSGEGKEMGTDRTAPAETEADSLRLAVAVGAHNRQVLCRFSRPEPKNFTSVAT